VNCRGAWQAEGGRLDGRGKREGKKKRQGEGADVVAALATWIADGETLVAIR